MSPPAFIRKVKRTRGEAVWGAYTVERDEFGTWLFTPERSLFRSTVDGQITVCYAGRPDSPGAPVLHLIPSDAWWFARWQHHPTAHVAIDICTPARLDQAVWSYDDLELDLLRYSGGGWVLVDEDEFAASRRAGSIDDAEAEVARAAADALAGQLRAGAAEFIALGWARLDRYSSESHPPITTFPIATTS